MVGDHAVVLFGHRAVVAAQPRLDVRDFHAELRPNKCRGHRGVHVAVHQHPIRLQLPAQRLEALHDPRRLLRVGQGADFEVVLRLGDLQFGEEALRQQRIVMLAGVDDDVLDTRVGRERAGHGSELHEIGAGPDDGHDAHQAPHRSRMQVATWACIRQKLHPQAIDWAVAPSRDCRYHQPPRDSALRTQWFG